MARFARHYGRSSEQLGREQIEKYQIWLRDEQPIGSAPIQRIDRGRAALERLEGFRPDLLILDVGLPDMNGAEVYDRASSMRSVLPNVRVLAKPWDFSMLTACLNSLLLGTAGITPERTE